MEYERALFRVYDKSMEGFQSRAVRNACNLTQKLLLVLSAGLFACLVLLHRDFVNNAGAGVGLVRRTKALCVYSCAVYVLGALFIVFGVCI